MSCRIKTITPFIDKSILLDALAECGIKYTVTNDKISIPNLDRYIKAEFSPDTMGKYILQHDSDIEVQDVLRKIEKEYKNIYKKKMEHLEQLRIQAEIEKREAEKRAIEEEQRIIEENRIKFVNQQKSEIIKRAEEKGYKVKEVQKGKAVQLVLVRYTY